MHLETTIENKIPFVQNLLLQLQILRQEDRKTDIQRNNENSKAQKGRTKIKMRKGY
jgi:hypothetical protein